MAKKPVRQRKKQVREWQRRQGSRKLKPHELDIYHLLLLFVVWVKQGSQPTLATFTTWCWQELRFSYIFEARPPGLLKEAYVQFLYSLVLSCLTKGIPPSAAGHIAEALAAGPHAAAAAALSARPRQRAQLPPAAGQEQGEQQQQQQQQLLQQPPGEVLQSCDGEAVMRDGQGAVEPLSGPHPEAAAGHAAAVLVTHHGAALLGVQQAQQAAAEQHQTLCGGVLPLLPVQAAAPGAHLGSEGQPAGQQNGLAAQLQGIHTNGSLQGPALLAVPVPLEHEPPPPQQPPGEHQRRESPASPLLFPTDPDLLPESELAALPALSPGLPQMPLHGGKLPHAARHVSTSQAAGPHADLAELQLATFLPADLDELLLGSPSPLLQSSPVKPGGGSKAADAGAAAQPPQPLQGGALPPSEAGARGGEDHEEWLEQFISQAADAPHPPSAAAAAAGAAQPPQQSTGPGVAGLVAGETADVARQEPQPATAPAAAAAGIAPAPAGSPALSKEFVEGLIESAGLALPAGALLALYCLYCAQPGAPTIKVYLTPEHQVALLDVLPRLQQGGFLDSVAAARQLLRWEALVPGSTRAQAVLPPIVPGGGLRREEAGVAREVKYHLASTLRGLATKGLAQLCSDYEESLSAMWASQGDPSPPRNIADLGVLRLLHEFTEAKHAEAHAVLREGKRWQPAGQAAAGRPATSAAGAEAAAGEGGTRGHGMTDGSSKAGNSKRANQKSRQPTSAAAAAAARPTGRDAEQAEDEEEAEEEEELSGDGALAGEEVLEGLDELGLSLDERGLYKLPAPARRAVKRKVAREKELDRRMRNWRQHMGVASAPAALEPLGGGAQPAGDEDDFDFDMPMLEGLEFGLASEAPPRTQQTTSARYGTAAAAQEHGGGSEAAGHSEGPAPSSGTEATVEGKGPAPSHLPAARPASAALPPIPTPAAVAALGPPVKAKAGAVKGAPGTANSKSAGAAGKAKAGAKAAVKGAPGTANGKTAGAAGKRATAAKASPAVKAAGGKKRTAAAATSGPTANAPKRARFADDAAAGTANEGRTVATTAKGARAGRRSNPAAGKASGSAASPRPPPAVAAAAQAAGKAAVGLLNEPELASLAQQAQQAARLALQALAEDEDYDAQDPPEAHPAMPGARDASGLVAAMPPAQPSGPTAAAGLQLGQPEPPIAPAQTVAEQSGPGKPAQQVGSVGRQGSIRQAGQQSLPGQQLEQAAKRRQAENAALEGHTAPGEARQLRHKQGEAPYLPSAHLQEGSEASAAAAPPAPSAFRAAAEPMATATKSQPRPAGQPAGSGMNGKAKGPGAPEGSAAGAVVAAAAETGGAAATALAAGAAGSPTGELDAWAARLAEFEAAAAAAEAALHEDAEV